MIDIHSHILPGVDDGARDKKSSLEMLKIAFSYGNTAIVATPHVQGYKGLLSWDLILQACQLLAEKAKQAGLNIKYFHS